MAVQSKRSGSKPKGAKKAGLTMFDIKRRQGTKGSIYDSRSAGGIRSKTTKKKPKKSSSKA